MLTRKTQLQLIAFAVISVMAVVYALVRFTDLGEQFGSKGYTVTVSMPDSGGVFPNGEVTYRGYNVGRIGDMRLTKEGIEVDLNIEPDMPPIPADVRAVAMNRSAVGEQLIDLRPTRSGEPYLDDGSKVTDVVLPPRTDEVIQHMFDLADSVPVDSLQTVVDESYKAFAGDYGDNLTVLMDTSREFVRGARQNMPDLRELLTSGTKVLRTQNDMAANIRSFTSDLRGVSQALKGSDADLRKLIDQVPGAATQVSNVVREAGPGASALLANLITVGAIAEPRRDGLEQTMLTYPALSAGAQVVTSKGTAEAPLGLSINLWDPPPCVKGYEDTEWRAGNETSDNPKWNTGAYCAEPKGSPIDVRGSQNVPYGGAATGEASDSEVHENRNSDLKSLELQRQWGLASRSLTMGGMLGLN